VIFSLFMGGLSSSPTSSSLFPPAAFFLFFEAPPAFTLPVSNPPFGFPGPPAPLYIDEGVFACDGVVCADDGVGESYTSAISTSHTQPRPTGHTLKYEAELLEKTLSESKTGAFLLVPVATPPPAALPPPPPPPPPPEPPPAAPRPSASPVALLNPVPVEEPLM
jgi:hypothetical protein